MISLRTLIISMALPSVFSYSSSSTPISNPAFGLIQSTKNHQSPQKYDLGLGKNKPLTKHPSTSLPTDVQTASQFWGAPEPAVEYPSPRERRSEKNNDDTKRGNTSTPIFPRRQSEDVLHIREDRTIKQTSAAQLDVNTVWVEMLIHDQQRKLHMQPAWAYSGAS